MFSSKLISLCRPGTLTCLVRPCTVTRSLSSSVFNHNEAMPIPPADGADKVYPAHIENLVTEISRLTLMEVADLNALLKKRLNIPDAAPMAAAMPMGMAVTQQEEEEEAVVKEVQTSFAVKLTGFDAAKKVAVIKFIKACVEGFNLVQAKKFVEALPAQVKADLGKDEATKLKDELTAIGAEAVVE